MACEFRSCQSVLCDTYRCISVKMSAHVLNLKLQLLLRSLLGALCLISVHSSASNPHSSYLEGKMFQKVSSAIGPVRLSTAASIYPDANGRCLRPRGVFRSNLRASLAHRERSGSLPAYCEPIGQSSALRLAAMADGCSKSSL